MASTRSTIEIIIQGITRGLTGAAAEAEAATRRVEAAEENVNRARTRSTDATGRLAQAEDALNVSRGQHDAALSRIGVAETQLEQVRARSQGTLTRLSRAEQDLDAVRARGGSAQEIAAAEERIQRVRTEADTQAARLQAAEARLASARANGESSASRIRAAEEALARARRNSQSSSQDLARAEAELVRRRAELDDADRRGSPLRSFFAGIVNGINPLRALSTLIGDVTTRMGGFGQALGAIGGPIVQAVTGIIAIVAAMSAWVEIVGVIGGLIGQALAGVPVLLFAIGAAAGTVILGMDGIKKAAEVLQPAFDRLKASVSGVFEKQLTPVFRDLAALLPQLTSGFDRIAVAVSGMIRSLVLVATTVRGVQELQAVLAGTAQFVDRLGAGITVFVDGMLRAASAAAPALGALGAAIGSIFSRLGDVFAKLADNGVILKAVQGLAATIDGLGAVIAPVVSLLIQMGAALGDSLGVALTDIGAGIERVTPFFVKLADVAGKVLVDAFNQLGPPLAQLVDSILPGAAAGLDGFASVMHNVVLPAVRDLINWVRTDGIPGFIAFTQAIIINVTAAASAILGFVSGALGALQTLFLVLGVATGNKAFIELAGQIGVAKAKVDELKTSIDLVHDKQVNVQANAQGGEAVKNLAAAISAVVGKTVKTVSNVFGLPENHALTGAINTVHDTTKKSLSNVFGTNENNALTTSIDKVHDKTVTSRSNVFGTQENIALQAAIDRVTSKTVSVVANVLGTGAVQALVGAINQVHSVTATVTTYIRQITQQFAGGGQAPGGVPILVGEKGPEIITLPRGGGFVSTAAQTRGMLSGGGGGGITVNVMLSQERIAEIARVEIVDANRSVRRTVLAGSGATF